MTIERCTLRQKQGLFGVSPIGYDTWGKLMANNIPSSTFGRLYPFSASSLIDPEGLPIGRTSDMGEVLFDMWLRNIIRTNSNIAIIGESGQGKSHLIKKLVCLQCAIQTGLFIVDSENEYTAVVNRLGGTNIECTAGQYGINPLQVRTFRDASDEDATADLDFDPDIEAFQKGAPPFFQHLSWLRDFFKITLPGITTIQLAALMILAQDTYKKKGLNEETDFTKVDSSDYPVLGDLYEYIGDVLDDRTKYGFYRMIDDSVLKELLLLLHEICFGALSPIMNRHTSLPNGQLINLNIQQLRTGSEDHLQAVLFNYLTYYWQRVMAREGRLILVLDELYLFLNRGNPTIAKYLNSFTRRARKYEGALITSTQKLGDCLDKDLAFYTVAIFDTPTYKFLFFPGNVDFELMKEKLSLTSGEISCINTSQQRNCLLKIGNVYKYHMTVGTLAFEAEYFGSGGGR